jgi:hypothetical protein
MDSSRNRQPILLLWLNLLGWQIEIEREGGNVVGVARHLTADGSSVRVGGCARTRDELAFLLFQAAMKIVEARSQKPRLLAA